MRSESATRLQQVRQQEGASVLLSIQCLSPSFMDWWKAVLFYATKLKPYPGWCGTCPLFACLEFSAFRLLLSDTTQLPSCSFLSYAIFVMAGGISGNWNRDLIVFCMNLYALTILWYAQIAEWLVHKHLCNRLGWEPKPQLQRLWWLEDASSLRKDLAQISNPVKFVENVTQRCRSFLYSKLLVFASPWLPVYYAAVCSFSSRTLVTILIRFSI